MALSKVEVFRNSIPGSTGGYVASRSAAYATGLQITAGQRTMSGLIADLTGQTPVLPVILTGHFWIQTLSFPYSCRLMLE